MAFVTSWQGVKVATNSSVLWWLAGWRPDTELRNVHLHFLTAGNNTQTGNGTVLCSLGSWLLQTWEKVLATDHALMGKAPYERPPQRDALHE